MDRSASTHAIDIFASIVLRHFQVLQAMGISWGNLLRLPPKKRTVEPWSFACPDWKHLKI